jgi:hypothetical protein
MYKMPEGSPVREECARAVLRPSRPTKGGTHLVRFDPYSWPFGNKADGTVMVPPVPWPNLAMQVAADVVAARDVC